MNTKKNLKWRLGKLPTSEEVLKLVNDKIITKEEARDILFNEETEQEKSTEDLKQEIKFLKELVEKLSDSNKVIETIRYIQKPYQQWGWYKPYEVWCSVLGGNNSLTLSSNTATGTFTGSVSSEVGDTVKAFNEIL